MRFRENLASTSTNISLKSFGSLSLRATTDWFCSTAMKFARRGSGEFSSATWRWSLIPTSKSSSSLRNLFFRKRSDMRNTLGCRVTNQVAALVIGGGISGLVCAYALRKAGVDALCVEASDRAGGAIRTEHRDGYLLELGPQSFSGTAQMLQLFDELGIRQQVVQAPAGAPRYVLMNGKLQKVPDESAGVFEFRASLGSAQNLPCCETSSARAARPKTTNRSRTSSDENFRRNARSPRRTFRFRCLRWRSRKIEPAQLFPDAV